MIIATVLGLCGLLLCLLEAVQLISAVLLARTSPISGTLEQISVLLDNSWLLPIGLLFVFLALRWQLYLPILFGSTQAPPRPAAFLLRGRPLIAVLAAAYLALMPVQIGSAHALRQAGFERLQRSYQAQLGELRAIDQLSRAPASLPQALSRLRAYARALDQPLPLDPSTAQQTRQLSALLRQSAQRAYSRDLHSSDSDLLIKSVRYKIGRAHV